ncbi:MAG: LptF/LptG family permease [Planctomycetes bacterium]|nr:LptF/LptG family permease [Planctomycetota bacterium]
MRILDRYIIRYYLINFVVLLAVFTLLFIVVDMMFNFDEFLDAGRNNSGQWGSMVAATVAAILDYYGPLSALLYVFFAGIIALGAMGFTFATFVRTGELGAMVSSGVSMFRIAAPILVVGFFLNAATLVDQEFVLPRLASKLTREASQVSRETAKPFRVHYTVDHNGRLLSVSSFDSNGPAMQGVTILIRSDKGMALQRITADRGTWDAAREGGGWLLTGVVATERDVAGPAGSAVNATHEETMFFPTDLSPEVLIARQESIYPRLLSMPELMRLAKNPAVDTGQIRQIMHSRFSLLVLNLLVLVMGLPFFLTREPVNMLLQGVKAAAVCLGAWGGGLVMMQVSTGQMQPALSAWLPVVIYLPVSAMLLMRVRT